MTETARGRVGSGYGASDSVVSQMTDWRMTGEPSGILVAGKGQAMAHIVSRIMRGTHGCEADREQDDHTEDERCKTLREHRCGCPGMRMLLSCLLV